MTTADDRCRLFFFDFFSTSSKFSIFPKKVFGPDASENILDRPGGSGRPSWGIRGAPGSLLGGPGALRGGSGGRLGGVLGALGTILGRHCEQFIFRSIFGSILVAKRVPKGRHFGSQNGIKIDPKMRSKFKIEKIASWDRLGSTLGRFGGCPGGIFIDFLLVFVIFRENRRFRKKVVSRRVLGRSWVDLGGQRGRLGRPWGVKLGVRRSQGLVLGGLKALRS